MPALFNSIALPAYALVNEAFPQTVQIKDAGLNGQSGYVATGHYIDVPVLFFVSVTTNAAVGPRALQVGIYDANNNAVAFIPASATQPESTIYNYTFDASVPLAYGPVGRSMHAPLPAIALFPGWSLTPILGNLAAGDTWSGLSLSLVRVPTGASSVTPPVLELVPTPIAL